MVRDLATRPLVVKAESDGLRASELLASVGWLSKESKRVGGMPSLRAGACAAAAT